MRLKEFDVYWMRTQSPKPEDWYKPIPEDHWSRKLVRWWMLGSSDVDTTALKNKSPEEIRELRKTRQMEKKFSSMFWLEPRLASGLDEELYDSTKSLKPRRTCYKVTSHHPKSGPRMACKKGEEKSTVPEVCLKKEKDTSKKKRGRGKARGEGKTRGEGKVTTPRSKIPKARPVRDTRKGAGITPSVNTENKPQGGGNPHLGIRPPPRPLTPRVMSPSTPHPPR
jgi:hypothetical protein